MPATRIKNWPISSIVLLLMTLSVSGCVSLMDNSLFVESTEPQQEFVIKGAKVFDGFEFIDEQDVWVKDGKIFKVGSNLNAPSATTISGEGHSLMPGLIDMHVHLLSSGSPPWRPTLGNMEKTLSANLAMGVTTVLDLGAPLFEMTSWENDTGFQLPRHAYAGTMFNVKDGHPAYMVEKSISWPMSSLAKKLLISDIAGMEDIKEAVDDHEESGVSFIKLALDQIPLGSPVLDKKTLKQLVDYAHSKDFKVLAHIGSEIDLLRGINAGVDLFVHGPYRSDVSDATIAKLKESGIPMVPTSVVFDQIAGFYLNEETFDALDQKVIDPGIYKAYKNRPTDMELEPNLTRWFDAVIKHRQTKFNVVERMYEAGIPLFIGSDSPNVATAAGSSLHKEMFLWQKNAGMTPTEILSAATGKSGSWLNQYLGWKIGRIAPGFEADLILVKGDLSSDVAHTQNIERIWMSGHSVSL